jgi:uncharacterized protein DUF3800
MLDYEQGKGNRSNRPCASSCANGQNSGNTKRHPWPKRGYLLGTTGKGITLRVVYSDESGVGNPTKEPITVVAAIVINMDRDWHSIENDLRTIISETPPDLLENNRSLKGRNLYSLIRKNIPGSERATDILNRSLGVLIKYRIAVFYGAVDRAGLQNYQADLSIPDEERQATSYDIAFGECLARLDAAALTFTDERILWIADRSDKEREPATKSALAYYRFQQSLKIGSLVSEDATRIAIADTVYFGHSEESVALQLADICCSTITNYLLEKDYGRDYCATEFYGFMHTNVMNDGAPIILQELNPSRKGDPHLK